MHGLLKTVSVAWQSVGWNICHLNAISLILSSKQTSCPVVNGMTVQCLTSKVKVKASRYFVV